jgi:NADP-dependent 3-hydroxy acid dehydrogenase YdfG
VRRHAITGASSGIGEAMAILLAAKGAKVVLGARRADRLYALVKRIEAAGGEAVYRVTDIKQRDDLVRLVDLACASFGAAALPVFKKQGSGKSQGSGHTINIISTAGLKVVPLQGVYAATKNAVRKITEALRQESGGQYRVTGISPGFVQTELADHIKDDSARAAIKAKAAQIAISPADIAGAVAYAVGQPDNVDVGDIVIRPAAQD